MQLFELNPESEKISLGKEIKPIKFKDVRASNNQNGKEKDIETIIAENPAILNYSENDFDSADLLIISRQLTSVTNKKADLVALDRDGYLITIEIKRDAVDEKNRSECMEFQSIRYAATHRTLDVAGIINNYAQYLKGLPSNAETSLECCKRKAVEAICRHLSDEDEVTEEKLTNYIDPTERQKIFLVAADFAPDCLSACAWLREHNIDIYCFKLQPYNINGSFVLHQERLIPPVALDEFYIGTKEAKEKEKQERSSRASSVKPASIQWGEEQISCSAWSSLLLTCLKRSLEAGVSIDLIPCPHTTDQQVQENEYHSASMISYTKQDGSLATIYVDKHGSRGQITEWVKKILTHLNSDAVISVTLRDGSCEYLNGEGTQQNHADTCD